MLCPKGISPAGAQWSAMTEDDPLTTLRADSYIGPLVEEHGPLVVEPAEDPFQRLLVSIIRQQVSMSAGDAIQARLFDAIEVTPAGVLAADEADMRDAGLSASKTEYMRALAEAWQAQGWSQGYFVDMADDAVADELTQVKGIGPWTADMFLMFGLGRPDVFPVGDLGIRKGMRILFADEDMTRAEMRDAATRWAPYRSYASRYLWRVVD